MNRFTPEEFARQIATKRKALDASQQEIALFCGVSPRTWWNWEHAKNKPPSLLEMMGAYEALRIFKTPSPK